MSLLLYWGTWVKGIWSLYRSDIVVGDSTSLACLLVMPVGMRPYCTLESLNDRGNALLRWAGGQSWGRPTEGGGIPLVYDDPLALH